MLRIHLAGRCHPKNQKITLCRVVCELGCVTPHVAQKSRYSAIDGRTTRHEGYGLSIKNRKLIEAAFGWAKTVGGMAQYVYRGVERLRFRFILTMTANKLARLPRLLAA